MSILGPSTDTLSDDIVKRVRAELQAVFDVAEIAASIGTRLDAAESTLATTTHKADRSYTQVYDIRDHVSDWTGASDVAGQVQTLLDAAPAGSIIALPQGVSLKMSHGIHITKDRVQLVGPGEMEWAGLNRGVANHDAIKVTGHRATIDGVRFTGFNGDYLTRFLEVHANDFTITNCTIDNWSNGIRQMPHGEFRGFTATGNIITDIYGVGTGPEEEATGDGILAAGSEVVITNNIVRAKPGTDPRIGICIEGLPGFAGSSLSSYDTNVSDSGFVVSGNIVSGPFRRAIHAEGVKDYVIANNVLTGMGWWGIMVWSAHRGIVHGNTINWTRTAAALDPTPTWNRAGIFVLTSWHVRVYDNSLTINSTARAGLPNAVELYENPWLAFERNDVYVEGTWYGGSGIFVTRAFTGVTKLIGNTVRGGPTNGIYLTNSSGGTVFIVGNSVVKSETYDSCIYATGNTTLLIIDGNHTSGGANAIRVDGGTTIVAKHNTITNVATGIWFNGGTNKYAPSNTFIDVTVTKVSGATSTTLYGPA